MKKALIILGGIFITALLIFFQQTRWGLSVTGAEIYMETYYDGVVADEKAMYQELGPEEYFGRYTQGWEYPDIFPSDKDEDYCLVRIFIDLKSRSFLRYDLNDAYVINTADNKAYIYRAWSALISTFSIEGMASNSTDVIYLDLYKNGRTDEEILRDLSELKIELHYSNRIFKLTKTIDLSKMKLTLLEKDPYDPN